MNHGLGLINGGRRVARNADEVLREAYDGMRALDMFLEAVDEWCLACPQCGARAVLGSVTARVLMPPSCVACNMPMAIAETRVLEERRRA
jgi:predicted RNA-binding Zn-ribbon protein involved in translation (DUF1610 family)